jgi:hypothetical protein
MGSLEAFFGITAAILAILVMVIARREKEEVRQQAYMEGHQNGTLEASSEAFNKGIRSGMREGREIGIKYLSPQEILDGIRHYIYICGEDVKGREGHRSFWIKEVHELNVERGDEYRSDWIKRVKELNVE